MRILALLRGAPGSGKTTFLQNNNLTQYAIEPDQIRLLHQSPILLARGEFAISQKNDREVWDSLFVFLERRMQRGELTIIDATHSKTADLKKYESLAERYRYRIVVVDFANVPLEKCLEQNKQRPAHKQVPEDAIKMIYERFATQKLPKKVKLVQPEALIPEILTYHTHNFNKYDNIFVIGDIHGSWSILRDALRFMDTHSNSLYIFTGDYIDRGPENAEVVQYLLSIYERNNVWLLEGNHELWLRNWAEGYEIQSSDFIFKTGPALEDTNIDKAAVRGLCRKFSQLLVFEYHGSTYWITHGGISKPLSPTELPLVGTHQFIKGVGTYADMQICIESFKAQAKTTEYQIFGHRNIEELPIEANSQCFNLEGKVEFGGDLRVVHITPLGISTLLYKNTYVTPVSIPLEVDDTLPPETVSTVELINKLEKSSQIVKRRFDGNITSYNFSRDVFYSRQWSGLSKAARGLFVNTATRKIVARSYNKFFNLGEREDSSLKYLAGHFKYPVIAYKKENGFLGLMGYDSASDKILYTSKSTLQGPYAELFRETVALKLTKEEIKTLEELVRTENVTVICEVVNTEKDPHIIRYDEPYKVFILDIIHNETTFRPYERAKSVLPHLWKTAMHTLNTPAELVAWVHKMEHPGPGYAFEGYVLEDSEYCHVKIKLPYYNFWKAMRNAVNRHIRSQPAKQGQLHEMLSNRFMGWIKTQTFPENYQVNMLDLRARFLQEVNLDDIKNSSELELLG